MWRRAVSSSQSFEHPIPKTELGAHPRGPQPHRYADLVPLYALGDRVPHLHADAYVHPDAVVIGDVVVGSDASIWPGAVLRGDYGHIEVGAATSVQDGTVVHATAELSTIIGARVVIGHLAHLEGCHVEDGALIGSGAVVLHRAVIGRQATVAAGAVVTNGMEVPALALAVGVPATIRLDRSHSYLIEEAVDLYVKNARRYGRELRRIDRETITER